MPDHSSALVQAFLANCRITHVCQLPYIPDLAFPKAKVTAEREEISDHRQDYGEHDEAVDGNPEKGLCRLF